MRPAHVIVGVDESPQGRLALRWAAAEAARRDVALQVVHAYGPGGPDETPNRTGRDARAAADRIVTGAVDDVHRHSPGVTVTGVAVRAGAAEALRRVAAPLAEKYPEVTVDYTVAGGDAGSHSWRRPGVLSWSSLGSRGHGGFVGLLLGSVGLHLTHHADCPVLIARTQ
jgi:nucleotide-binding universal stress UspA family protein